MNAGPDADLGALADLLSRPGAAPCDVLDERRLALADQHGITPLLAELLRAADRLPLVEGSVRARLVAARRAAVVLDAVQRRHEQATLGALVAAGVDTLVFKGAALAVSHYATPWLRPRGDVDILVPVEQAALAQAALVRAGCRKVPRPEGAAVTYQARYAAMSPGVDLAYDLHWRLADPQAFAEVIDLSTLRRHAVPGPVAGSWMPDPVHALLIACVHRAAHHFDTDRLLLLYDIDRLVRRFDDHEWRLAVERAEAGGIRAVCARGLERASARFGSPYPAWVRTRFETPGAVEPTARFVSGAMRKVDVLGSDLRRLPTWRARAALVREHLYPPRDFMAARYGAGHPLLRPGLVMLLYIDRIVRGITGWFRPVL